MLVKDIIQTKKYRITMQKKGLQNKNIFCFYPFICFFVTETHFIFSFLYDELGDNLTSFININYKQLINNKEID